MCSTMRSERDILVGNHRGEVSECRGTVRVRRSCRKDGEDVSSLTLRLRFQAYSRNSILGMIRS
jgi:hypothetical protein